MELCLMIEGQEGVTWPQWVALARACEQHGIPSLFRSDHYMNLDGQHPERGSLDAWGTLCGLAAETSTLRLGTMVSPATFRHPSMLAKIVTTADLHRYLRAGIGQLGQPGLQALAVGVAGRVGADRFVDWGRDLEMSVGGHEISWCESAGASIDDSAGNGRPKVTSARIGLGAIGLLEALR
jgi:hypothetical protein